MARPPRRRGRARKPTPSVREGVLPVNGHSMRWVSQGFPWVYPDEVVGPRPPGSGVEVEIEGPGRRPLGRGLLDDGWIAARIYRHDGGPLDDAWLHGRLEACLALRERAVLRHDTTCCRLVHGENDDLPGIRVDWWDGWAVISLDSPAAAPLAPRIADWLVHRLQSRGVHLCYRPDPRETLDPSAFQPPPGWLVGAPPEGDHTVVERGLSLRVRPGDGHDVGAYMDMRDVRSWLAPHWLGRRVLNTFAYTGAFSVHAVMHGASRAVSVDLSAPYLERLEANIAANGQDPAVHEVVQDDVFKALDRLRRTGDRFDVVILDPPSFSHGPGGTWSAKQDMPRLVNAAARVLDPGGWLVAASNQGQISPKAFRGLVADGLRKASRVGRELTFLGAAPDFPAAVSFPEGHYLKVGVWALD